MRSFATFTFTDAKSAEAAIAKLNTVKLSGSALHADFKGSAAATGTTPPQQQQPQKRQQDEKKKKASQQKSESDLDSEEDEGAHLCIRYHRCYLPLFRR